MGDSLQNSLFASKNSRFLVFLHAIFVFLTRQNVTLTHENPALMDGKHNFVRPQLLKRGGHCTKKNGLKNAKNAFPLSKSPVLPHRNSIFFHAEKYGHWPRNAIFSYIPIRHLFSRGRGKTFPVEREKFFPRVVKKNGMRNVKTMD